MEKFTAAFDQYKSDHDGKDTGTADYLYDYEKIEKIITQAIKKHEFLSLITTKFTPETANTAYEFSLPIVNNTDTENHNRTPRNFVQSSTPFDCKQINLDVIVGYSELNKFSTVDFEREFNDYLGGDLAQNLTMIGFHGERRALDSDHEANPLGQDVAKGWHAQLKEKGQIVHAATLEGKSPAQLIKKALEKLPVRLRESGDLIAICGRDVFGSALVNLDAKQLNSQNGVLITAQNLIGGLRAISAPFFPADCILITTLSNLAIYFKQNTARLFFKQEPRQDSIQIYFSVLLDYLLENHRHAVLIDGIQGGE
ncbi:phage major capsid protein, P2 family [Haemophilus influenzae]|nr:phage major capsid protein, P2 family [Haemophilus influenzae]MCK8927729.1 phage major capsid protein, P2 family [Haemophilus influenzae]MCK8953456.1 phage major capsid protein, P2 family [Haemophilus influenzae]